MNNATSQLGKPGTITKEEFTVLNNAVTSLKGGARILAAKVAKICSSKASALKHEYPASTVAAAYDGIVSKILNSVGKSEAKVPGELFSQLTAMVAQYGPEVVIWKLAKIAKTTGNASDSALLSGIFPNGSKTTAAKPAARSSGSASRRSFL